MTNDQIIAAVEELVRLARVQALADHMYATCNHNQDYLNSVRAAHDFEKARIEFVHNLTKPSGKE